MKAMLLKLARFTHSWLDKKIKKTKTTVKTIPVTEPPAFHSLAPVNNADIDQYITALNWALDNRKTQSIHNIALTGPYGSGKSSILKTFKEQNTNKDYVFLEISLATFKEEGPDENGQAKMGAIDAGNGKVPEPSDIDKQGRLGLNGVKKNEDVLRLIELSILQQIFYHEEDSKIPDSRFKKIKSFNRTALYWITGGLLSALLFGYNLFYSEKVAELLKIKVPEKSPFVLHWFSLAVFVAALATAIFHSVRNLYGLKISKFKFQQAEIEIDKGISKSILNNHLDEILYFFEVTPYSVVLIEDLDRFRQAEIFTKLRELNMLINNSKKIKDKEVVFIYAVRDDMFRNKDRTKFFDFIIPVIPVINSSNSNDKLAKIVEQNKYKISGPLIDDVSLFIDDMRLLYNIMNEYGVYSNLLDKALDQDKLLAILVYKNIYPDDFVLLGRSEGKLFELMNKRNEYIREMVQKIEASINANKEEIKKLQLTMLMSTNELRLIYVTKFVNDIGDFKNFKFKGKTYNILEAATADVFEYFIPGNFTYERFQYYNGNFYAISPATASFSFATLEKEIDQNHSYVDRLNRIESAYSGKEELLKLEIERLEKQHAAIRHAKLQEILADKNNKLTLDNFTKQGQLLNLLLRSGYINEDYLDYISLFYEGSITKEDRAFLLNVKSQQNSDYDTALTKISNLIAKIGPMEFKQPYLLNFNLMDFVLINDSYSIQLDHMLDQLNDRNDYGTVFIDGFISNGTNTEAFIKELLKKWAGLWKYVDKVSDFTAEKKEKYFKLILANTEVKDISKAADVSNLSDTIAKREDFLSVIPDGAKLKRIILVLQIKFENVDLEDGPQELAKFIITGAHYRLNDVMVRKVIAFSGNLNVPVYEQSNYNAVLNSGVPELIDYIDSNMNIYVEKLYLALHQNIKEPEATFLRLLNHTDITLENRNNILTRSETKISRLSNITVKDLDDVLFMNQKILPSWENLFEYYNRNATLNKAVVEYLNIAENAATLAANEINLKESSVDGKTIEEFLEVILNESSITDESYKQLINPIPYSYNVDELPGVTVEKMAMLIARSHINPKPENFAELKYLFPGLQNLFMDVFVTDFLSEIDKYTLDENDITYILCSDAFSPNQKLTVIKSIDQTLITDSNTALNEVARLLFDNHPFAIPKPILISVIRRTAPVAGRVKLFNMHHKEFTKADINVIFSTFPAPYNKIGVRFTSPVVEATQENIYFANNLKEAGFIANKKPDKNGIKLINFK